MRRKVVMVLLGLGVIGGYGSAAAHLMCAKRWHAYQRQQFMNEVAATCANSMKNQQEQPTQVQQNAQNPSGDEQSRRPCHRGGFWNFWRHQGGVGHHGSNHGTTQTNL